jgi:putative ABC transport system permease protein
MRRALRSLIARPIFATVAIATLALGIGVNAAIFSLTRATLFRPLPYRDSDRLATVFELNQSRGLVNVPPTPFNYAAWRDRVDAFEQTAAFVRVQFNVFDAMSAVQAEGFVVDAAFFPMLGIEPALGRSFTVDDTRPGGDAAVMLSDGFWRRRFAADPAIVGRTITVDGTRCTVIGVLPASFKIFRVLNRELEIFRPLIFRPTDREHSINLWAKLKPGVSIEQARAQLATVYATLPIADPGWSATANLMSARFDAYSRSIVPILELAVGFVLLIACANVANLLLAVAAGRRKELAVRIALGAGRWRIARDLAGESLLLAAAGAALGALAAVWMVAAFNTSISYQDINRSEPFRVDGWVLAFTAALATAIALVFALVPVRTSAALNVVEGLKESTQGVTAGGSSRRLRHGLIIVELTLSTVLAASAIVLARSAAMLHRMERGLAIDGVMTAQVALNDPRYADSGRLVQVTSTIARALASVPGIADAAIVNYAPLALIRVGVPVDVEGQPPPAVNQRWVARYWVATPNYFRTVRIPILAGRDFTADDDASRPGVAIVAESFARRFWNTLNVIGRRVRTEFPASDAFWIPRARRDWLRIVGVAGDVREDGVPDAQDYPQLYLPYAQNPTVVVTLMARATGPAAEMAAPAMREAVRSADPQLPLSYEMTFDDVVRETFARPREAAWLIAAFAALAFALSAIGVYGVVAYSTTARAKEIAIRMALGASRSDIVALIVRQSMVLTAVGVVIGVAATPLSLRLVRGLLFGVEPFDPWTLGAVAAALAVVGACAAAIPAWRAAQSALPPQVSRTT